jgi:streptogramin lyase
MAMPIRVRAISSMTALAVIAVLISSGRAAALPEGEPTEFPTPTANSGPTGVAPGPDGNLWFTEEQSNSIGRITPTGAITEFAIPTTNGKPYGITPGPDGNLWFTEARASKVGEITPTGAITEFTLPTTESEPLDIAPGPDGNLWFAEAGDNQIGRITPGGTISEFPIPTANSYPEGIAQGPDGSMWFTEADGDKIGRLNPGAASPGTSSGITEFAIPTAKAGPAGITTGPDGNLWFAEFGQGISNNKIGRITPGGTISEFPTPSAATKPLGIAPGPEGDVWFTERASGELGRIDPGAASPGTSNGITEFSIPTAESEPDYLAPGSDGNLWFAEFGKSKVGRIGTGAPEALTAAPTVSGGGRAGAAQMCNGSWATWGGLQPSDSLFGFDGYRWLLDGSQIAAGRSYTPIAPNVGHQLSCAETVTYPLPFFVSASATSTPVVVAPAPAPPLVPIPAPTITAARESASTWRLGRKLARISRRKPPIGTTFSFALNEPAAVRFTFTQRSTGRRVGAKCVAKSRKNARHKTCTRTVTVGTLSFTGHTGTNKVAFQGRTSRSRKLKPGRYALIIVATNSAGTRSTPVTLRFTIVR